MRSPQRLKRSALIIRSCRVDCHARRASQQLRPSYLRKSFLGQATGSALRRQRNPSIRALTLLYPRAATRLPRLAYKNAVYSVPRCDRPCEVTPSRKIGIGGMIAPPTCVKVNWEASNESSCNRLFAVAVAVYCPFAQGIPAAVLTRVKRPPPRRDRPEIPGGACGFQLSCLFHQCQ